MKTIGKSARNIARELREKPTKAEDYLWSKIRNRQFCGLKFLFQHPIFYTENNNKRFFIADFYCSQIKLLIEIDGEIHSNHVKYDQIRTDIIQQKKIKVIRFSNAEVLGNINKLLIDLKRKLDESF